MNVLSLFDGMSCGRIALERAGVKVYKYYASEINKHAITVSKSNYPDIIHVGDVTKVGRGLPHINLLIAGSPCQGFSNMGAGLNFEDPKSKLFFEFIRIKKQTNPDYFLLENVRMKKEWVETITNLVGVEPIYINSKLFSAQSRPRIYWTNIPVSCLPVENTVKIKDILLHRTNDSLLLNEKWLNRIKTSSDIPKMFSRVDPDIALCLTARMYANWKGNYISTPRGIRRLDPVECERLQTVPDGYTSSVSLSERYKMLGNGWTVDVVSHIFKGLKDAPFWEEI